MIIPKDEGEIEATMKLMRSIPVIGLPAIVPVIRRRCLASRGLVFILGEPIEATYFTHNQLFKVHIMASKRLVILGEMLLPFCVRCTHAHHSG